MKWFKPKTLLDKTYELGILLKGVDGVLELIGGVLILVIKPKTVDRLVNVVTSRELARDPNDFIATHILQYGHELANGHNGFAAAFLLTHGIVKIVLVAALLRNKLWAYPFALGTLGLFVVYQVYRMIVHPTLGMLLLTVLDVCIIWLIWREWQKVTAEANPL